MSNNYDLKSEYDFSHGERGKFYHPDAEFSLPVYLEPDEILELATQVYEGLSEEEIQDIENCFFDKHNPSLRIENEIKTEEQ